MQGFKIEILSILFSFMSMNKICVSANVILKQPLSLEHLYFSDTVKDKSYSYPQKSDSKLNKFFYTKFAVYDKEKINISI